MCKHSAEAEREHVKLTKHKYRGTKYEKKKITKPTSHIDPVPSGRTVVRKASRAHHAHTNRVAFRILNGVPVILQHLAPVENQANVQRGGKSALQCGFLASSTRRM